MPQLQPADTAPAFALSDTHDRLTSLADYAGQRVILYFFPAAMTPGCTIEAVDFNAALETLADAGLAVIGVSPDSPQKLARFRDKEGLSFTLLADPDRTVMDAYGAFGSKTLYGKVIQGVIRSTFIIDVDAAGTGTIVDAQYNVRASGHVARLLRELGLEPAGH